MQRCKTGKSAEKGLCVDPGGALRWHPLPRSCGQLTAAEKERIVLF